MDIRQQFKRRVIELIHGLPYEEATQEQYMCLECKYIFNSFSERDDSYACPNCGLVEYQKMAYEQPHATTSFVSLHDNFPITIGRAMQALMTFRGNEEVDISKIEECFSMILRRDWQLTKANGSEATDDDQSDETIAAVLNILEGSK
jgi:rubredoxin